MASRTVSVKFSKPGTQPPVYLAGSFSDPAWQPQEMQHTVNDDNEYEYHKDVQVEEGKEYQYKFRVGEGDWWILNEEAPTVTDDIGNRNNLLAVSKPEEKAAANQTKMEAPAVVTEEDASIPPPDTDDKPDPEPVDNSKTPELPDVPVTEDTIPPLSSAAAMIEKADMEHVEEHKAIGSSDTPEVEHTVLPLRPAVVVENADSEPQHAEAYKADTAVKETDAPNLQNLSTQDAEPEYVVVRKESNTPEMADAAAEVADAATGAGLDAEEPAPVVPDNEAGHIGLRRISRTPIPEVADTAAEVADADAEADAEIEQNQPATPPFSDDEGGRARRMSEVAAEVADAAKDLDRDQPTPLISDEEAGRIGLRRMSSTPIPEVADTAAEVADVAAILDKDHLPKIEIPSHPTDFGDETPESGTVTPFHERAPLFAHECLEPPSRESVCHHPETPEQTPLYEEAVIDPNDPTLEEFPSERLSILERMRTVETRLSEDQTAVDGVPPSPIVGANSHPERLDLPAPSPALLAHEQSPSLDSIAEEHDHSEEALPSLPSAADLTKAAGEALLARSDDGERDDLPTKKPVLSREPSVEVKEVTPESPPPETVDQPTDGVYAEGSHTITSLETPFVVSDRQLGHDTEEVRQVDTGDEGPNVVVTPATPGSSLKTRTSDPFENSRSVDTAKASAIEEENGRSQLKSRKQPSPVAERPLTPNSMRSGGKDAKSRNFLKAFWRVVFVEWIGGIIMRLCGGRRSTA